MNEVLRNEKGHILPGYTANPNGRPRKKTFAEYFSNEEREDLINKLKTSDKPEIWMKVAEQIFGKAKQPIVGGDDEDNPIQFSGVIILPQKNESALETTTETNPSTDTN